MSCLAGSAGYGMLPRNACGEELGFLFCSSDQSFVGARNCHSPCPFSMWGCVAFAQFKVSILCNMLQQLFEGAGHTRCPRLVRNTAEKFSRKSDAIVPLARQWLILLFLLCFPFNR
ncbi:unnamed protein product [Polarella glacialis]|uniref:Uncharacterized protein n=1 Tax=Polarella glacialis TaxID=89957 RepID=A0A813EMW0_POLGL|nr:unnamed protein product [Polarella glacialis]